MTRIISYREKARDSGNADGIIKVLRVLTMRKRFPWKAVTGMLFALMLGAAIAAHELGLLR
jgi:hypothetical protein